MKTSDDLNKHDAVDSKDIFGVKLDLHQLINLDAAKHLNHLEGLTLKKYHDLSEEEKQNLWIEGEEENQDIAASWFNNKFLINNEDQLSQIPAYHEIDKSFKKDSSSLLPLIKSDTQKIEQEIIQTTLTSLSNHIGVQNFIKKFSTSTGLFNLAKSIFLNILGDNDNQIKTLPNPTLNFTTNSDGSVSFQAVFNFRQKQFSFNENQSNNLKDLGTIKLEYVIKPHNQEDASLHFSKFEIAGDKISTLLQHTALQPHIVTLDTVLNKLKIIDSSNYTKQEVDDFIQAFDNLVSVGLEAAIAKENSEKKLTEKEILINQDIEDIHTAFGNTNRKESEQLDELLRAAEVKEKLEDIDSIVTESLQFVLSPQEISKIDNTPLDSKEDEEDKPLSPIAYKLKNLLNKNITKAEIEKIETLLETLPSEAANQASINQLKSFISYFKDNPNVVDHNATTYLKNILEFDNQASPLSNLINDIKMLGQLELEQSSIQLDDIAKTSQFNLKHYLDELIEVTNNAKANARPDQQLNADLENILAGANLIKNSLAKVDNTSVNAENKAEAPSYKFETVKYFFNELVNCETRKITAPLSNSINNMTNFPDTVTNKLQDLKKEIVHETKEKIKKSPIAHIIDGTAADKIKQGSIGKLINTTVAFNTRLQKQENIQKEHAQTFLKETAKLTTSNKIKVALSGFAGAVIGFFSGLVDKKAKAIDVAHQSEKLFKSAAAPGGIGFKAAYHLRETLNQTNSPLFFKANPRQAAVSHVAAALSEQTAASAVEESASKQTSNS